MASSRPHLSEAAYVLAPTAQLGSAETVDDAVAGILELSRGVLEGPTVDVLEHDPDTGATVLLGSSASGGGGDGPPVPDSVVERLGDRPETTPGAVSVEVDGTGRGCVFVPAGRRWVLRLEVHGSNGIDETAAAVAEELAAALGATLDRIDDRPPAATGPEAVSPDLGDVATVRTSDTAEADAMAFRRLHETTVAGEGFGATIERLLSLGREYVGLDTALLAHVDGDDYEIEAVVDATDDYEPGAVYDLGETMCQATVLGETTEPVAFADVADTEHRSHPASDDVRAYIAAPVVVGDETYGTVNFSMDRPREAPFRPAERTFVGLLAAWIGTEIERRRRLADLRRYETILEAVDDPVYALDTDGQFTFVNEAAKREFGYGTDVIGSHVSVGMDEDDVDRIREQIETLLGSDERSVTSEFDLETADGETRTVENRLALIGDEFHGTAGVLRDVTARKERRRRLESFRRAIEQAADGIAVLDDGEYTYIDRTHVEMYGFDDKEQLLGDSWRRLYDEEEIERLEETAFPALESDGHWRGRVTGSRPDGSTFPAELSLTIVDDGRLVCTVRDETEREARKRELELKERAMDEATVGIQITDATEPDNPLVYVNDGFERMTGYDAEEAVGRNPRSLRGEAADPEQAAALRGDADDEMPVSAEFRNYRADGTPYRVELSVTPIRDDDGTVTNYVGIQQDVTERRRRERQTEATVEALERVYEVTTDPGSSFEEKVDGLLAAGSDYLDLPYGFLTRIETDGDAGTQTVVQACGDHDRLQPGDVCPLGESYCKRTVESEGLMTVTHAAESGWADDPAYDAFGLETYIGGSVDIDERNYGTLCFASSEARETEFSETERSFVRLLRRWVSYEIDRRNDREELRQQRARLDLTLSETNTGIAEWDLETGDVSMNETYVEMIGRDIDSVEGFESVVDRRDRDTLLEALETLRDGEPWTGELRVDTADEDPLWVRTRAVPVDDDGDAGRVLATSTDITDRKRRERERRRSERRYRTLAENIPNGGVLLFDGELEYTLAAGELLGQVGLAESDIVGRRAGTVMADGDHPLVPRFRAALDGTRTDRRVELDGRTLRIHVVPVDGGTPAAERGGLVLAQDVTEEARREEELYNQRERFRLLVESVEEYAFLVVGEDGDVATWNGGATALFGHDAGTAVGMPMARLHPENDRTAGVPERLLQQARLSGESAFEGHLLRADGSTFHADVRYAPLETDDDEFRGYAMIVRDMTDRRRQRRRTERFVEESDDVVTVVDPDGTITYASGSADRVLDHDPETLVGENVFDYVHPESREQAMAGFFDGVEQPGSEFHAECRFRAGDDEWRHVEGRCQNMLDDDAIGGMLLYLRDVTESKKQARRFEGIFNQTFQFTGLLELDGTIVEANDAALEFGGIDREDIVGEPLADVGWWNHSEAAEDSVRDAIERAADGNFVRYETEAKGADGFATVDFSVKPVTDEDGDVSLLVAEGRDITARRQHRQHLEVMQRVLRHNMRNDLTKVRGWTEAICEEPDADERAEQFETVAGILDDWDSMTRRMGEIRRTLRSPAEQQTTTAVGPLLEDAVAPVREAHDDLTVTTDVSGAGGATVPVSLTEAVRELVQNAAAARDDATVEVELSRADGDWLEIEVQDDGPGMPAMEAEVIETGEETPLNHGKGLGLWMVRMIVTQAGGDLAVETDSAGTTVTLRLPVGRDGEPGR